MLFTDIILIYAALMLVRFGWLWTMKKFSNRFLKKKPMEFWFVDHTRNPDRVFRWGAWGDHSGRCALYPAALAGW